MGQAPRPQLFCRAHLLHPLCFSETPGLDTCQPSRRHPLQWEEFTPMDHPQPTRHKAMDKHFFFWSEVSEEPRVGTTCP